MDKNKKGHGEKEIPTKEQTEIAKTKLSGSRR